MPRTAHRVVMVRSSQGGSGYRISDDLVLTAAHVVGESGEVKLFDTDNWLPFQQVWYDDDLDVAVLKLEAIGLPTVSPARWGLLSSAAPRVPVEAHGFPTFQTLGADAPRDYEQIDGHVNPLSGAARRQFHISVDSKLWRTGPHPWPGMSGAPVLCHGRLIGVITETVGDSNRLAATPITEFIFGKEVQQALRDPCHDALPRSPGAVDALVIRRIEVIGKSIKGSGRTWEDRIGAARGLPGARCSACAMAGERWVVFDARRTTRCRWPSRQVALGLMTIYLRGE